MTSIITLSGVGVGPSDNEDDEELIRSEMASAEAAASSTQSASLSSEASTQHLDGPFGLRKISDNKEQQTDLTYGHVNKKIQADTMGAEDVISDVDVLLEEELDAAAVASSASVLSQSLRSTHSYHDSSRYYRYKPSEPGSKKASANPIDDVGFLNVAMHHLVQDELQVDGLSIDDIQQISNPL